MKFPNKNFSILILLIVVIFQVNAQENKTKLTGEIKYNKYGLRDINIINKNSKTGTSSDENGTFELFVQKGDSILFSSLSFQHRTIVISENHIKNKAITVYLEPGYTALDEVEIIKNIQFDWKKSNLPRGAILDKDAMSYKSAPNMTKQVDPNAQMTNGINFSNIYHMLTKNIRKHKRQEAFIIKKKKALAETLKLEYGNKFFTTWLGISQDQIHEFLDFCQANGLGELYNQEEIYIKDFFVKQSKLFLEIKNSSDLFENY